MCVTLYWRSTTSFCFDLFSCTLAYRSLLHCGTSIPVLVSPRLLAFKLGDCMWQTDKRPGKIKSAYYIHKITESQCAWVWVMRWTLIMRNSYHNVDSRILCQHSATRLHTGAQPLTPLTDCHLSMTSCCRSDHAATRRPFKSATSNMTNERQFEQSFHVLLA